MNGLTCLVSTATSRLANDPLSATLQPDVRQVSLQAVEDDGRAGHVICYPDRLAIYNQHQPFNLLFEQANTWSGECEETLWAGA